MYLPFMFSQFLSSGRLRNVAGNAEIFVNRNFTFYILHFTFIQQFV